MDEQVRLPNSHIDCSNSGTTAVIAFFDKTYLTVANVGDSRCVIGSEMDAERVVPENLNKIKHRGSVTLQAVQLSVDHKPTIREERFRVEEHGGEIRTIINEKGQPVGPYRIWKKGR